MGGLWHRNLNAFSFTTAVDSSCKLDYQEQGWPSCAIGINYPETLFISTGKAPSRLENFQYGHSSKSVNYKCNRIIENLSKSKTIPSDITQSKDTLWLAVSHSEMTGYSLRLTVKMRCGGIKFLSFPTMLDAPVHRWKNKTHKTL